jgi:hypothetical protein
MSRGPVLSAGNRSCRGVRTRWFARICVGGVGRVARGERRLSATGQDRRLREAGAVDGLPPSTSQVGEGRVLRHFVAERDAGSGLLRVVSINTQGVYPDRGLDGMLFAMAALGTILMLVSALLVGVGSFLYNDGHDHTFVGR